MMNREEYLANPVACRYCGGETRLDPVPDTSPHEAAVVCCLCRRNGGWIKKPTRPERRRWSREHTERIWKWNGGRCACCNLTAVELAFLGIGQTVQHTPAFADLRDGKADKRHAQEIPFCERCQAFSAAQMGFLRGLIEKLARRVDAGKRVKRPIADLELDAIFPPEDAA